MVEYEEAERENKAAPKQEDKIENLVKDRKKHSETVARVSQR